MHNKIPFLVLGVGGFLVFLASCGGIVAYLAFHAVRDEIDRDQGEQDLVEIALAMLDHDAAVGRTPANLGELEGHLNDPEIAERIHKGEIQVVWNALRNIDQPAGAAGAIYAWETKARSSGKRTVVYMDGLTQELTESEFRAAAKAAIFKAGQ